MVRSKAATVGEYLAELPEERRGVIAAVRDVILKNLPKGYREAMNWGMISYEVPLETYPATYNGQPLCFASLAAQKNHNSLYLMCVDAGSEAEVGLREAFARAGKKLDMGKSCVRFKTVDDLELGAIGKIVKGMPPKKFIAAYEAARKGGA